MLDHQYPWRGQAETVCWMGIAQSPPTKLLIACYSFEIQDVDPEVDAEGKFPAPYRASVASLVPIPLVASGLPEFQRGKQVYALYPQTTTFYKAEMVGMKTKEMCRLRFEGEEERDKEMEVERRYVLDTNQIK